MRWDAASPTRRAKTPARRLLTSLLATSGGDVLARWLFMRGLGLVYWVAFRSLRRQLLGLYGERGVLPIRGAASDPGTMNDSGSK